MWSIYYANKNGGDKIGNFRSLIINTELKIIANRLQAVLSSLISSEKTCAVKGRTIQNNLYLVRLIFEQIDSETAPINLDQS